MKEITDYIKLFDYDINLLVDGDQADRGERARMTMDLTILQFLAAPFAASLILTGIHAYLGVHVVERGVIFVDLSLAQIAALGATIALLLPFTGGDPHAPVVYWISLGFTFVGAAVFSTDPRPARADPAGGDHRHLLRGGVGGGDPGHEQGDLGERAPQGHAGRQHPRRVVAGGADRRRCSTALIGLFHFVFRQQFLAISMDHDRRGARRASRCASGISSSTPRSASS